MSAKVLLGAMVAASVLAVAWGARDRGKPPGPPPIARAPETPWLSKEVAAQIVGDGGMLGPLFANLTFGLEPSAADRARIAEVARANNVDIDLEVVDGALVAIRFEVAYGGCCGYEGAEVLALRANRPSTGGACFGEPSTWVNDWSVSYGDGTFARVRVDVNRISFRWEPAFTTGDVIARADELLGADTRSLAREANERWRSIANDRFTLDVPYVANRYDLEIGGHRNAYTITADRGRVAELSVGVRADEERPLREIMTERWGRPKVRGTTWTWRKADRIIEVDAEDSRVARLTMRRRAV